VSLLAVAPALPLHSAGKYVAGAYIVFVVLILVYVAIMAIRLGRTERDLAQAEIAPPSQTKVVAEPPPPAAVPAQRSNTATVSIVRGLKREEYTVMQDGKSRE